MCFGGAPQTTVEDRRIFLARKIRTRRNTWSPNKPYIFRFTVTNDVTCEPSAARHEIVKVVGPTSGTVAAPPERDD